MNENTPEEDVLATLMMNGHHVTRAVQSDVGLKSEHFATDRNRAICRAIFTVSEKAGDESTGPDQTLVIAQLRRDGATVAPNDVNLICSRCGAPGNSIEYAKIVIEDAQWRTWSSGVGELTTAVKDRDQKRLAKGRELLNASDVHSRGRKSPAELQARLEEIMKGAVKKEFPFPIARLNKLTAGGLGRGEHMVVAGHSGHGKSFWVDQLLSYWSSEFECYLLMNEMTDDYRSIRRVSRKDKHSYSAIAAGNLTDQQRQQVRTLAKDTLNFWIEDCTGMTAREISNEIRLHRPDVAVVDLVNNISPAVDGETAEKTLTDAIRMFTDTCRQANCLMISVAHLSEKSTTGTVKPRPTVGDIRNSGMIKNAADVVCFVWRDQDLDRGLTLPDGEVILGKVRNGLPDFVRVMFDDRDLNLYERFTD